MQSLPLVAIIGRPNVGKSTLFNRIIGERRALVSNIPGLTRDRHYAHAEHGGSYFIVTDTGGYEDSAEGDLAAQMRQQTLYALEEADCIIFLCDVKTPNDPVDLEILERLRKSGRRFYLAVNKCENDMLVAAAYGDFSAHGLDEIYPITALHGGGIYELLDEIMKHFPKHTEDPDLTTIRVAIVGRQNVGKSTLVNRLLGEERMIASPVAGTTRDAIDTDLTVDGQRYTLIDTAGIRRRSKVERGAEMLSVVSSMHAIERAEIVVLLLDATREFSEQDAHIAGHVVERGRAAIIVINKWDLLDKSNATYGEYIDKVREHFSFMRWAPILMISAHTGQRAPKLWGLIKRASEQFRREFVTSQLNLTLKKASAYLSPPTMRGASLKMKYIVQTGTMPPVFTIFVNDPKLCHFSYKRFLDNQFRAQLEIDSTPLMIRFRRKAPPRGWERVAEGQSAEPSSPPKHQRMILLGPDEDFSGEVYDEDDAEWIEPGEE